MFCDPVRQEVFDQLRQCDLRVFAPFLTLDAILQAARRVGLRVWASPLNVVNLVWLAVACAWRQGETFCSILTVTLKLLQDQEHFADTPFAHQLQDKKRHPRYAQRRRCRRRAQHSPYGNDPIRVSEEAFVKARRRLPWAFWVNLLLVLGELFAARHGQRLKWRQYRLLALDGTRLDLPDVQALRSFYGTASNARGRQQAQARMVLLQSPLTRLPVAYELEPVTVGEVTMARQLSRHLRPDDLVLLDAGYCSYGLLCDIHDRQHAFFCLRVRRHLNLRTVQRLDGRRDRLVRWTPRDSRGQWRQEGLPKSLDLRLVEYEVPGHRAIRLLTNVLSPLDLPYADLSRLTTQVEQTSERPGLYHLRWQIETSYAELKVDQELQGGLRSKTPASIGYEVAGHMVLYLLVRWLIVAGAERHGVDPVTISFRNAVRELAVLWPSLVVASEPWAEQVLWPRLLERIASHRVKVCPGRAFPRKKKTKGKGKAAKAKAKKG